MSANRIKFYHTLRFKLSLIIASIIFVAVLGLSIFNALNSLERETENFRALTQGAASAYAATVADSVEARDQIQTLSALRGIRDLPNIVQVDITLSDGSVFAELGSGAWIVPDEENVSAIWEQKNIRTVFPIIKGGREIAQLSMLADIQPLRSEILSTLYATIAAGFVVCLFGILAAQYFVAQLTAPLKKLTTAMLQIRDNDDKNHTMELRARKDETGLLTNSFSDMIDTIRERDQQIAHHMESLEHTVEERTKDLRLARDEAEAANAAKSDFLATMSHEIRTPMNGMMVMAEMLGSAELTPRHKRYADIIHRSGKSLLTIINDILDLSKIEAGQLDLEFIPTSLEGLIMDVASLFWERARGKNLELATYVSPRVPDEILADPTRLNQVISNLVNNALKFTDHGGVLIRLDAKPIDIDTNKLIIEVIDTGIGIPADKIDHIFESFSQADQSTTRKYGGTGLGLTVCQRLVSAMGGEITVSSQPGKGSCFRVTFDAEIATAKEPAQVTPIRIGVNLPDGLVNIALSQSLRDAGATISPIKPDFWITSSADFVDRDVPSVLLTDIGDTHADNLLKSGRAHDVINHPYSRAELSALVERASNEAFRGLDAISSNAEVVALESFEGLRILAVDDNAVNREVLREALSRLNADATFAEDGAQALGMFKQATFDLVLMDGSMPVMDGFEATRQIRNYEAQHKSQRVTIYALTAQIAGTDEAAWQDAGADGHILKPFTLEKLSSIIAGIKPKDQSGDAPMPIAETNSIFDTATVTSLEQLGDNPGEVRNRIWDMFFSKVSDMAVELRGSLETAQMDDLGRQAHALKSMSLSSGFKAISEHLQDLENRARNGQVDSISQADMVRLDSLIHITKQQVDRYDQLAA